MCAIIIVVLQDAGKILELSNPDQWGDNSITDHYISWENCRNNLSELTL